MYILLITRGYPTEKYKLNGIFELDQAKALASKGHKVVLAAIDTRSIRRKRKFGIHSIKKAGVNIECISIPCGKIPKKILNYIRIKALKRIYKVIIDKYGKPDIIHAHFIEFGYIMTKVFYNSKVPLVLTEHSSSMNNSDLKSYFKFLGEYTYPKIDKVISVSESFGKKIKYNFHVETKVIPNIVDTSNFYYSKNKKDKKYFDYISIGRLTEEKGMMNLISTFIGAFINNENVRLFIFGEGILRSKMEQQIKENNLEERIFLMGIKDRKEIALKMNESHCFVLPSQSETFGVVYIEAMAAGLPIIATNCGGPNDIVNKENGILIPVDDIEELKRALIFMYNNIDKYKNEKISEEARNLYSSECIAEALINEYKILI